MRHALVCLALLVGCQSDRDRDRSPQPLPPATPSSVSPSPSPAPGSPAQPAIVRGAAGDEDVRVLLADVASAKACEQMKGQFRGVRAPDNHDLVTGVLWIRDCKISNDGPRVRFELIGNGWQWTDQEKKQVGGTFRVRQYVRFGVDVTMNGTIDLAYAQKDHVVSLWFTPREQPHVEFRLVGDVDVDRAGVWASAVSGLGSLFGKSPEKLAEGEARTQGTDQFIKELGDGMTSTIALCTGLGRFNLGRPPKGVMAPADLGETKRIPVELQPGGLVMAGPHKAPNGMSVDVTVTSGTAWIGLVCADYASNMATAFVAGQQPSSTPVLAQVTTSSSSRLRIKPAKCPVVAVARTVGNVPAKLSWQRPPEEIAWSLGGPVIRCGKR